MPILDVTIVGPSDVTAAPLADRAGEIFGSEPGHTWVRLHRAHVTDYAENRVATPPPSVFAPVILRQRPEDRVALVLRLTEMLATATGRDAENVHVVFEPAAAGRIAFGGELVPAERKIATSGAK